MTPNKAKLTKTKNGLSQRTTKRKYIEEKATTTQGSSNKLRGKAFWYILGNFLEVFSIFCDSFVTLLGQFWDIMGSFWEF